MFYGLPSAIKLLRTTQNCFMRKYAYQKLSFILVLFLLASIAQAQKIQPSALKQIQSLIAEKESRTPAQQKINSQLLYAAKMERGERITSEVATLEVNVNKGANGLVDVTILCKPGNSLTKAITSGGGQVIEVSARFNMIIARVPLSSLEQIASFDEVKSIYPTEKPSHADLNKNKNPAFSDIPYRKNDDKTPFDKSYVEKKLRPDFAARAAKVRSQLADILSRRDAENKNFIGAANSQGDVTHKADLARTTFSVNGAGIKIGILSDSYDTRTTGVNAADDVLSGDLPGPGNPNGFTTPVTVLSDFPNGTDEGRAMLQIVHDLAPGAQLFYATAFTSEAGFAQGILDLRAAGCDIICDDVFYFNEPPFQDGLIAQAVNTVTADGAIYFSSAGNQGNKNDNTSSVWEGDFLDGGASAPPLPATGNVHDFGGSIISTQIISNAGNPIRLFWSDPWGGSGNDYDLFSLNSDMSSVLASSTTIQSGSGFPMEGIAAQTAGRRLVIIAKTGAQPRALHLNAFGSRLGISTPGQTHGHSGAAAAFSVAASNANVPYPGAFNSSNVVENFSSDGVRRIFYTASGTPITPGNLLFATNGGEVRQKPDITAADGVSTTLPGGSGLNPFFGTSAAAPHAAAITALLKQRSSVLTPAQIRTALISTAIDIETPGVDRDAGHGIVMALEALTSVSGTPTLEFVSATLTAEGCTPANNVIDPGESVTVSFCVRNIGGANTTTLIGTLLPTGGITNPSAPQVYGVVTQGGASVCRDFTFTNNGVCGGTITMSVQFQDGALNLGTYTFTFQLGEPVITFSQNFDAVTAPALPAGWATDFTGAGSGWTTSTTNTFSAPNSAFGQEAAATGVSDLVSSNIPVTTSQARLSFRNSFNFESGFDGAFLEIKIGAGAFQDIITAGGSFISGGYNSVLAGSTAFPGKSVWTGLSGGSTSSPAYVSTVINLPAAVAGQNIQLRWRVTSDQNTVATGLAGIRIDDVVITDGASCCTVSGPPPTVTINQAAGQADPTSSSPINFTVVFSEAVTGFTGTDVSFTGSTAGGTLVAAVTGSGTTYNVAVSGMNTTGLVVASVPAGVASSASGALNLASTSTDNSVTYNAPPLTVTIDQAAGQADPTSTSPINFTVVFSEAVTGFTGTDISFTGSTVSGTLAAAVTGSGATYNVAVSGMTSSGLVVASVPAGVASTAGGGLNLASTSTDNSVTYNAPPLAVTINQAAGQADPTSSSPINFTVVFSESATGFTGTDISFTGSTAGGTLVAAVTGSGATYNVAVSGMTSSGLVVASVPAGVASTVGGELNLASTSTDNSVQYNYGPPTVTINQAAGQDDPTLSTTINFTAVFNEPVTGFTGADVILSGTAGANTAVVTGSGTTYNVAVSGMTDGGTVIATIPADVAIDADGLGNLASTSTDNTVTFISCVLTCPADIIVNNTAGQCGAIVTFIPGTTGGCGVVTSVPASGSFFPVGTTVVTISTTGGPSCTFNVTVNDVTPPVITCPQNIVVSNDPGICAATVNYALPGVSDNCALGASPLQLISGLPSGSVFPIGTTTIEYRATDVAGNTSTCSFTVTVNDTELPVIDCPSNITVSTSGGLCTAAVSYTVSSTDNCPGVTQALQSGLASGASFPIGVNTVTWKATDAAGNERTCSFTVTVLDGQVPVITAQPVNDLTCEGENGVFSVTATNAVSYQWQAFNGSTWNNIPGATASVYTVNNVNVGMNTNSFRVIVTGHCSSVTSTHASLYVNKLPIVQVSASPSSELLPNQRGTISATGIPSGGTFVWYFNGSPLGATGATLTGLSVDAQGSYTVVYTDPNGCVNTSGAIQLTAATSDKLFIYPSPNAGQFQVRYYNSANERVVVSVYDSRGSKVYESSVTTAAPYTRIDVNLPSSIASGVYLVRVSSGNNEVGSRLIVVEK